MRYMDMDMRGGRQGRAALGALLSQRTFRSLRDMLADNPDLDVDLVSRRRQPQANQSRSSKKNPSRLYLTLFLPIHRGV